MKPEQKAINSACRMLGIREHSEKQLRIKLTNKGYDKDDINTAIKFLYEENWLSNERFCESFVRSKKNKGQGRVRVEQELAQHGVTRDIINKTIDNDENDWQDICNQVLAKKIATYSLDCNKKINIESKMKLERFMRYRGFETSEIKEAFSQQKNHKVTEI